MHKRKMFICAAQPDKPEITTLEPAKEGDHLFCISYGGRPSPQLKMVLDGKVLPSSELPTNGSYKVIKTPIERSWNGNSVECRYSNEFYTDTNKKMLIVKCKNAYYLFFVVVFEVDSKLKIVVLSSGNDFIYLQSKVNKKSKNIS